MAKFPPQGALPRRVPGDHRVRFVTCPGARDWAEVDEPTPDLVLRVRDALRAWPSTGTEVG